MTIVRNMHAAKTEFSHLVAQALAGNTVIVAKSGHPVVTLVPWREPSAGLRVPGTGKGSFRVSEDFDAPLPKELVNGWYA